MRLSRGRQYLHERMTVESVFQMVALENDIRVVIMCPNADRAGYLGHVLQQLNRLQHVIEHAARHQQVVCVGTGVEVWPEISQDKFRVELESVLRDEAFEECNGIGLDGT